MEGVQHLIKLVRVEQGILHRDIKPENLLLAADGSLKLCDFGLALDLTSDTPRSCVGTLDYMPPEVGISIYTYQTERATAHAAALCFIAP